MLGARRRRVRPKQAGLSSIDGSTRANECLTCELCACIDGQPLSIRNQTDTCARIQATDNIPWARTTIASVVRGGLDAQYVGIPTPRPSDQPLMDDASARTAGQAQLQELSVTADRRQTVCLYRRRESNHQLLSWKDVLGRVRVAQSTK